MTTVFTCVRFLTASILMLPLLPTVTAMHIARLLHERELRYAKQVGVR